MAANWVLLIVAYQLPTANQRISIATWSLFAFVSVSEEDRNIRNVIQQHQNKNKHFTYHLNATSRAMVLPLHL
jgi:hypothetical protein